MLIFRFIRIDADTTVVITVKHLRDNFEQSAFYTSTGTNVLKHKK